VYGKVLRSSIAHGGRLDQGLPLRMLELDDGKLSCPVLRRLGAGNSPRLSGTYRKEVD
jgi:hypothetical protein